MLKISHILFLFFAIVWNRHPIDFSLLSKFLWRHGYHFLKRALGQHIDVEAGLSLMKSTIAESGMGVTSRPYRTKHIEF